MDYKIGIKRILVSVVAATAILGVAGMAMAAEYSADVKQSMPGLDGKSMNMNAKIYVKGQMERRESTTPMGKMISITRRDKGVMWMLMPAQKSYMEQKLGNVNPKADPIASVLKMMPNYKKVGTAKIAGFMCDKYTFKDTERKTSGTAWISPQLKAQVKMDMKSSRGNMTYALTNIKMGTQPNSLFNIPKGYKKMQMGMGMPGMGGPGKGMPGMGRMPGGKGMPGMPGMPPPPPK
ncbi:MAG: DUF4412 domain-containing protein [Armatimonadota bacterium]